MFAAPNPRGSVQAPFGVVLVEEGPEVAANMLAEADRASWGGGGGGRRGGPATSEIGTLRPLSQGSASYGPRACSGLAFLLYAAALEHLEASQVAAFIYLEPLVAQALAVALLGEPLTAALVGGGAAILAGGLPRHAPAGDGTSFSSVNRSK